MKMGHPYLDFARGFAEWPIGPRCVLFGKAYMWVLRAPISHVDPSSPTFVPNFDFRGLPLTLVRADQ